MSPDEFYQQLIEQSPPPPVVKIQRMGDQRIDVSVVKSGRFELMCMLYFVHEYVFALDPRNCYPSVDLAAMPCSQEGVRKLSAWISAQN